MHLTNRISTLLIAGVTLLFLGCNGQGGSSEGSHKTQDTTKTSMKAEEKKMDKESGVMKKKGITVKPADISPKFKSAELTLTAPKDGAQLDPGKVHFKYNVENYKLGVQTRDAAHRKIAKSAKGQHIHLILNNNPYSAHYEPEFDKELEEGHYVALSFFARSYHESVKHDKAYQLIQFNVGNSNKKTNLDQPMLFYSRPKGTYEGKGADKLLFDFYLINTSIGKDGNKVRLTIDDGPSFEFTKWIPYTVEGLSAGKHDFKIELLDKDGNLIKSPFNQETRTITLKQGGEMKADKMKENKQES